MYEMTRDGFSFLVMGFTEAKVAQWTTSLNVAQVFGKNHFDVIDKIKNLECSKGFNDRNFTAVEYQDRKGEMRPMHELTRDGFSFLVMGLTGAKAAQFKEAYIDAFNKMEEQLKSQAEVRRIISM